MVAIPAVTKILTDARKGTYADTALNAISSVRQDYLINGSGVNEEYDLGKINGVLEKTLVTSPFGEEIKDAKIEIIEDSGSFTYKMCIWDAKGNGFELTEENNIDKGTVQLNTGTTSCSATQNNNGG